MDEPLNGVVADVPTPRKMDGSINFDIVQVIVDRMIHAGVSAILVVGTVGNLETSNTTPSEYIRVVEAFLEAANGKIRIIAGIPDGTIDYINECRQGYQDLGCYAVMFMCKMTGLEFCSKNDEIKDMHTPFMYCSPDLNKFEDVAYGNDIPLNKKYFTKFNTKAQIETDRIFNGKDSLSFSALSLGAPGIVTGMAAILPYHCVEFYRTLIIEKNVEKARLQWDFLWQLANLLEVGNYSAKVKAAMRFIGIDTELDKDENNGSCNTIDLAPLRNLLEGRTNVHLDNGRT